MTERHLLVSVTALVLAFGCSGRTGSEQGESGRVEVEGTETRPREITDGQATKSAVGMAKMPQSVLSGAQPIVASDLFKPAEIARLEHNIRIKGRLPLLRQNDTKDCWAAVSAMLAGWRSGQKISPSDYLAELGGPYSSNYAGNTGLHRAEKEAFLKRAGLVFEWGASYAPRGIEKMLRDYGPLWFTISGGMEFGQHATIVVGLVGTGDMKSTFIIYADPADGMEHALLYPDYMKAYEDVAYDQNSLKDFEEGFQVVHYP